MARTKDSCGRFLVLDGVDGCGKSTQATRLAERLSVAGQEVLHVREPGTTAVGESLRTLLLDADVHLEASVETLLFAAARRQLLDELVGPALERGAHVVCERFHASTYAYQAVAGELEPTAVMGLLESWASDPAPHLELILDLDPETALGRRGADSDRIEAKGLAFQQAVARGYGRYAELRGTARLVDASGSLDGVSELIWEEVQRVL
ncbi:MAG: dTMP kinase [Planctomycetota bacterium]|jgi:dTMP kinase